MKIEFRVDTKHICIIFMLSIKRVQKSPAVFNTQFEKSDFRLALVDRLHFSLRAYAYVEKRRESMVIIRPEHRIIEEAPRSICARRVRSHLVFGHASRRGGDVERSWGVCRSVGISIWVRGLGERPCPPSFCCSCCSSSSRCRSSRSSRAACSCKCAAWCGCPWRSARAPCNIAS